MATETTASIIAAVSALSGVVVSQLGGILRSFFDKNNQRTALLRDKLEELADNVHKTTEWLDQLLSPLSSLAGKEEHEFPYEAECSTPPAASSAPHAASLSAEARRVYVLSLLYFPPLREEARNLLNAVHDFYLEIGTKKAVEAEKLKALSASFASAKKALDELIKIEAEKII